VTTAEKPRRIASADEYRAALDRVFALFDAAPGTPEADELEQLVRAVEDYERAHYRPRRRSNA